MTSAVKHNQNRDSIENQKSIIQIALKQKGDIGLRQFYVNENAKGTFFARKDLQQIMEDIVKEVMVCVIIKDKSRLDRYATEAEFYAQHLFPKRVSDFLSVLYDFDITG